MMAAKSTRTILHTVVRKLNHTVKSNGTRPFWNTSSNSVTSVDATTTTDSSPAETYTWKSLVREVATEHDLSVAQSERIVKTVFDTITENLEQKKVVKIKGFGSFSNKHVNERMGRSIQSGEPILISARQRVKFNAYRALKDLVNK